MRICLINDCTGFVGVAPCCLDCEERQRCPDRCPRTETTVWGGGGGRRDDSTGEAHEIFIGGAGSKGDGAQYC